MAHDSGLSGHPVCQFKFIHIVLLFSAFYKIKLFNKKKCQIIVLTLFFLTGDTSASSSLFRFFCLPDSLKKACKKVIFFIISVSLKSLPQLSQARVHWTEYAHVTLKILLINHQSISKKAQGQKNQFVIGFSSHWCNLLTPPDLKTNTIF